MTLEQLRIFVAVAEKLHMTLAAETLNLSQSAASAAISTLEKRHGVMLFNRVGRRIELTKEGQAFLAKAHAVLVAARDAELTLVECGTVRRGEVTICASQTVANYWLPPILVDFKRRYPTINVKLSVSNTARVQVMVREGAADIGIGEGEMDDHALEYVNLCEDQLIMIVAKGHEWSSRTSVEPGEMTRVPWIMRERGSGTRSEFEGALRVSGVNPEALETVLELASNESVRAAAEAGIGAAVISALVAAESLANGRVVKLEFPLPKRAFVLVKHRERHLTKAASTFVQMISSGNGF